MIRICWAIEQHTIKRFWSHLHQQLKQNKGVRMPWKRLHGGRGSSENDLRFSDKNLTESTLKPLTSRDESLQFAAMWTSTTVTPFILSFVFHFFGLPSTPRTLSRREREVYCSRSDIFLQNFSLCLHQIAAPFHQNSRTASMSVCSRGLHVCWPLL